MPSVHTKDPEGLAIQVMVGTPFSLVEENRPARIRLAQEHHPISEDLAVGHAASVIFLNAVRKICS